MPIRSLQSVYSDEAIRSFVEKLRRLAVDKPHSCRRFFRVLDAVLAGFLHETTDDPRVLAPASRVPDARVLADKLIRFESRAPFGLQILLAMIDETIGDQHPQRPTRSGIAPTMSAETRNKIAAACHARHGGIQ